MKRWAKVPSFALVLIFGGALALAFALAFWIKVLAASWRGGCNAAKEFIDWF